MSKEEVLTIDTISTKGYGQGSLDSNPNKKIEIAHTVIGDKILVQLNKRKRKGRLLEILEPSKDRTEPRCPHASLCGGCSLQQLKYEKQLELKELFIMKAFSEILFSQNAQLYPILPCEFPWQYRNKMEFSFSENRGGAKYLGLMIAQANSFVFNLTSCHLAPTWAADTVKRVREYWENTNIQAYFPPANTGSLRTLTLRHAFATDEKMIILTVSGHPDYALSKLQLNEFVEVIKKGFDDHEKLSIFLRVQQTVKGEPTHFFEMVLFGKEHIKEKLTIKVDKPLTLSFLISPTSFFQPNSIQAENLYTKAIELADLKKEDIVFDLYAGTGTLGIAMATFVKKVVSIELNKYAVFDAKQNAEINNIHNVDFYQGDVKKVLATLKEGKEFNYPDVVIVDPPRAGLEEEALSQVLSLNPKKIVYISCNPLTQARDTEILIQKGYKLSIMQPIDQFPHTAHIENIALFVR